MASQGTTWTLAKTGEQGKLAKAIQDFHQFEREAKEAKLKADLAKSHLLSYCEHRWLEEVASTGDGLPTPIKLCNAAGQSVTFVIADKTGSTSLDNSQYGALVGVIGKNCARAGTRERKRIYFDGNTLDQSTLDGRVVYDAVEEFLSLMVDDMVIAHVLTAEQSKSLYAVKKTRTFTSDFMAYLPGFCNLDVDKLRVAIAAIGSALVRYIKV